MSAHETNSPAVDLVHVVLAVRRDGTVAVTADGEALVADGRTWRRASFPEIIDLASHNRTLPVRVEVTEVDGRTFTDLLPARPRPKPQPTAPETAASTLEAAQDRSRVVSESGFLPGEQVALAAVVETITADGDGRIETTLGRRWRRQNEVVVVGRSSGTLLVRRLS